MTIDTTRYRDLGQGIWAIDAGLYRPRHAACYLVQSAGEVAFIDTGTAHTVPRLLALLDALGLSRSQVRYVIPTHVHLDHGGGAGALMAELPAATLVAHPKGAPHLIDPQKLRAGAVAVYGEEEFAAHFGGLVPVPEQRLLVAEDGRVLELGERRLEFMDTPGHANHHGCVFDSASSGFFTGDTFGICYPDVGSEGSRLVFATTTPVAFDPDAWQRSLDRLLGRGPEVMFLTHFGPVTAITEHATHLRRSIEEHRELALEVEPLPPAERPEQLRRGVEQLLLRPLDEAGITLGPQDVERLLGVDIALNSQGLEVWLQRRARARERAASDGA